MLFLYTLFWYQYTGNGIVLCSIIYFLNGEKYSSLGTGVLILDLLHLLNMCAYLINSIHLYLRISYYQLFHSVCMYYVKKHQNVTFVYLTLNCTCVTLNTRANVTQFHSWVFLVTDPHFCTLIIECNCDMSNYMFLK